MIDVKELRVGAHINVNGKRVTVDEITNNSLVAYITNDNDWAACSPDEDWINPIPLTAALLQELGFHEVKDTYFSNWHKGWLKLTNNTGQAHPWWIYNGQIRLMYLHQLENLYYLTTKTELIEED